MGNSQISGPIRPISHGLHTPLSEPHTPGSVGLGGETPMSTSSTTIFTGTRALVTGHTVDVMAVGGGSAGGV